MHQTLDQWVPHSPSRTLASGSVFASLRLNFTSSTIEIRSTHSHVTETAFVRHNTFQRSRMTVPIIRYVLTVGLFKVMRINYGVREGLRGTDMLKFESKKRLSQQMIQTGHCVMEMGLTMVPLENGLLRQKKSAICFFRKSAVAGRRDRGTQSTE